MDKKRLKLKELSRSKRSKSRDKENPNSIRYTDSDFTSPGNFSADKNRPRASELHPLARKRLIPYSDSDSSASETENDQIQSENERESSENEPENNEIEPENSRNEPENDQRMGFAFAAVVNPYAGKNKPKISGNERALALRYQGETIRIRIEKYVRDRHKEHARYLDAVNGWKTQCFIKRKIIE